MNWCELFFRSVAPAVVMVLSADVPTRAATLSYLVAARSIEDDETIIRPVSPWSDFNVTFTSWEHGRLRSRAAQDSHLGAGVVTVTSVVGGELGTGRSYFRASFSIDEPTPFLLRGRMELSGSPGFACISLVDMAYANEPLVNDVAFTPPGLQAGQEQSHGGWLLPGNYTLEAMIYAGGEGIPAQGFLDLHFSIPEPNPFGIVVLGGLLVPLVRSRRHHGCTLSRAN